MSLSEKKLAKVQALVDSVNVSDALEAIETAKNEPSKATLKAATKALNVEAKKLDKAIAIYEPKTE